MGHNASADTDLLLRAGILSSSRAHGLFAGIALQGSTLRPDDEASANVYGRKLRARKIVIEGGVRTPASGHRLLGTRRRGGASGSAAEWVGRRVIFSTQILRTSIRAACRQHKDTQCCINQVYSWRASCRS